MREILFRGKRTDNGKWVEGFYSAEEYNPNIRKIEYIPRIQIIGKCVSLGVLPETVGQYTGLTDKNGRKVFERDIIKAKNPYTDEIYIGIVEWGNFYAFGVGFVILWDTDADNDISPSLFYWVHDVGVEVVGNCYDNPELIKGGENDG